jgi:hypothetical protein
MVESHALRGLPPLAGGAPGRVRQDQYPEAHGPLYAPFACVGLQALGTALPPHLTDFSMVLTLLIVFVMVVKPALF